MRKIHDLQKLSAIKFSTTMTLAVYSLTLLASLAAPPAQALLATTQTGVSEMQGCENFCSTLANSHGLVGIDGKSPWSTADDQWCANHGSQTNPSILAAAPTQGSSIPNIQCAVPLYPGDTDCAAITTGVTHCSYHNSQVESHCVAVEAAKDAAAPEKIVAALDVAATAACSVACFSPGAFGADGGATASACKYAGIAAGSADAIQSLFLSKGGAGRYIEAALGAGSAAYTGLEVSAAGSPGGVNMASPLPGKPAQAGKQDKYKQACYAAAAFAMLTGLRAYNIGQGSRVRKKECSTVASLLSNSSTALAAYNGGFPLGYGGSTGTSSSGSSGALGNGSSALTAGLQCINSSTGQTSQCGTSPASYGAATDGGLLAKSGLDKLVAPLASKMDLGAFERGLEAGNAGGALGNALSGLGSGGQTMAALEKYAEDPNHAQELAGLSGGMMVASSGGGGGSAPARDPANDALSGLFNKGDAGAALGGGEVQNFQVNPQDIWHTGTDQNLFQIVSGKIEKVTARVTGL